MTRAHGRHLGLVRGGRSARLRATLQAGNTVGLVWRARLDEHLGSFAIEPLSLRAGRLMASAMALAGINYLATLVRILPERDPHEALYEAASDIAEALDDGALAPTLVARFEAQILAECGFQLDLSCCAATGVTDDLVYVSPKSGRAVSAEAGAPWRDRLLPLPPFLREGARLEAQPSDEEIADGFRLTGFFLARDLFLVRGESLPDSRAAFLKAAAQGRSGLARPSLGAHVATDDIPAPPVQRLDSQWRILGPRLTNPRQTPQQRNRQNHEIVIGFWVQIRVCAGDGGARSWVRLGDVGRTAFDTEKRSCRVLVIRTMSANG